jgi:hypothetical protein
VREIAAAAAELLLGEAGGLRVALDHRLMVRGSTGPAAAS